MSDREYNQKVTRRSDLLLRFMRLEEIATNHLHPDELAGYHYVIPKDKFDKVMNRMENSIREIIDERLVENSPVASALEVLLNIRDEMVGKRATEPLFEND